MFYYKMLFLHRGSHSHQKVSSTYAWILWSKARQRRLARPADRNRSKQAGGIILKYPLAAVIALHQVSHLPIH